MCWGFTSLIRIWFRQHGLHHPITAKSNSIRFSARDTRFRVFAFGTRIVANVHAFCPFRVKVHNHPELRGYIDRFLELDGRPASVTTFELGVWYEFGVNEIAAGQITQTTTLFFDDWNFHAVFHRKFGQRDPSLLWSTLLQRPNRLAAAQDWRGFESAIMDFVTRRRGSNNSICGQVGFYIRSCQQRSQLLHLA